MSADNIEQPYLFHETFEHLAETRQRMPLGFITTYLKRVCSFGKLTESCKRMQKIQRNPNTGATKAAVNETNWVV